VLVERHFDAAFHRAEETTLARWLAAMPAGVAGSRPRLLAIRAFLALLGGHLDETEQLIADAEARLATAAEEPFEPSVGRARSMVANLPAAVAVLHSQAARFRGDTDRTIAHARRARAALTGADRALGAVVDWQLAVADWLQGRVRDAELELRDLTGVQRAGSFRTSWPHYDLGQVLVAQGRLAAALRVFEQVIDAPGLGHVGVAEVRYARDELDAALDHASAGVEACRRLAHDLPLAIGLATLARARQAAGDPDGALEAIEEAAGLVPATEVTALLNPVPTVEARLLLARGETDEAARRAAARGWDALDDLRYLREREHLVMARVLLAQGRADQADALLARLHGPALAQDRTGSVLEIQALRALALAAAGDEPAALTALADAVTLAQPEGHVRVFSDEGPPMADLLARLITGGRLAPVADARAASHVGHLLRSFGSASPSPADRDRGAAPGLAEPLTDREMDVLELLAAGRSNQQIADHLFVALVTVKKHVSHILDKLGAANRTEAVARARGLGLLR
jgi:LuxR family transcriptional regulator, maltose regulon positive regulatory protein